MRIVLITPYLLALMASVLGFLATRAQCRADNLSQEPSLRESAADSSNDLQMIALILGGVALTYSLILRLVEDICS